MDFELIQIALRIANDVHNGQVDLDGKAMLLHPLEVVLMGNSFDEMLVGILHDVVEDSHYTFDNLLESGIPTHVVETLRLLTHSKDENYDDYILRIIQPDNKIAIAVKWNDLTHNLKRGKRSNHIKQTHGE
jgi:(p)ppGpp synthase/HD superfamily hydrolase